MAKIPGIVTSGRGRICRAAAKPDNRKRSKPSVALCALAPWIDQQLDQEPWRSRSSVARELVNSLSTEELRDLPAATRRRLKEQISAGRITNADRRAVDKLLTADLVEVQYQPRIFIKGAPDFVEATKSHLASLAQIPIGRKLFRSLFKSGKRITIISTARVSEAPPDNFRAALAKGAVLKWRDQWGKERTIKGSGTGSDTTIKYNPHLSCSHSAEDWRKHPPEIGLAHELIHADDAAYGRLDPNQTAGVRHYECQAVGLPPYEQKEFTENRFRAQWPKRLAPRANY